MVIHVLTDGNNEYSLSPLRHTVVCAVENLPVAVIACIIQAFQYDREDRTHALTGEILYVLSNSHLRFAMFDDTQCVKEQSTSGFSAILIDEPSLVSCNGNVLARKTVCKQVNIGWQSLFVHFGNIPQIHAFGNMVQKRIGFTGIFVYFAVCKQFIGNTQIVQCFLKRSNPTKKTEVSYHADSFLAFGVKRYCGSGLP